MSNIINIYQLNESLDALNDSEFLSIVIKHKDAICKTNKITINKIVKRLEAISNVYKILADNNHTIDEIHRYLSI